MSSCERKKNSEKFFPQGKIITFFLCCEISLIVKQFAAGNHLKVTTTISNSFGFALALPFSLFFFQVRSERLFPSASVRIIPLVFFSHSPFPFFFSWEPLRLFSFTRRLSHSLPVSGTVSTGRFEVISRGPCEGAAGIGVGRTGAGGWETPCGVPPPAAAKAIMYAAAAAAMEFGSEGAPIGTLAIGAGWGGAGFEGNMMGSRR